MLLPFCELVKLASVNPERQSEGKDCQLLEACPSVEFQEAEAVLDSARGAVVCGLGPDLAGFCRCGPLHIFEPLEICS